MKRLGWLPAALAALVLLTACGARPGAETPNPPETAVTAQTERYRPAVGVTGRMHAFRKELPVSLTVRESGTAEEAEEWLLRLRDMRQAVWLEASRDEGRAGAFSTLLSDQILQLLSTSFRGAVNAGDGFEQTGGSGVKGWTLTVLDEGETPLWGASYDGDGLLLALPGEESRRFAAEDEALRAIGELLWQAEQKLLILPGTPPVSYRLLINDPLTDLRCGLASVTNAGEAELLLWNTEWRSRAEDESTTAALYVGLEDVPSREGSAEDIRRLLNAVCGGVAGLYAGDQSLGEPLLRAAAEGASGGVLWSASFYPDSVVFSPDGLTGYRFAAEPGVGEALAAAFRGE